MQNLINILTIIGGGLGIIAFVWNVIDTYRSFLRLTVEVKNIEPQILIKTIISNNSKRPKELTKTFLLVSPEGENPVETINHLFPTIAAKYTNDICRIEERTDIYKKNRAFIPLSFFSYEQVRIGDEEISYTSSIKIDNFEKSKTFSVRFYVFAENRYHRLTQDLLVL